MMHPRSVPVVRRAVTAVEFAFIAPVFFFFLLGLIEIGRCVMVTHLLTHAARTGCRVGVIDGTTTTTIQSAVDTELGEQRTAGATVTISVNGSSATDASAAVPNDVILVNVSVPISEITWLPGGRFISGNVSGRYSLRRE
jgi:Flp pilus assembly protein TadG